MPSILLVCPHYPASDKPDVHRVRACLDYFESFGWHSHVLAVNEGATVTESGQKLTRVRAFRSTRLISAVGLRAFWQLYAAGCDIIRRDKPDVVLFSTTAFPLFFLGYLWRLRFGVPYVLDFHDPWATFPAESRQFLSKGPKARLMQLIHQLLERPAVRGAAGLVAVNRRYLDTLRMEYGVTGKPVLVQPFPYLQVDFEEAVSQGTPSREKQVDCLAIGRVPAAMTGYLSEFLTVAGQAPGVTYRFLGTRYDASEPAVIEQLAGSLSLQSSVIEEPDRVSLQQAIAEMMQADVLLLFSSADSSYVPSRVNQYLASGKPIVLVGEPGSELFERIGQMSSVLTFDLTSPPDSNDFSAAFEALRQGPVNMAERHEVVLEGSAATQELTNFLGEAISHRVRGRVLVLFSGIEMLGSERANLEVISALIEGGFDVRVLVSSAPWAVPIREVLESRGIPYSGVPYLVVPQAGAWLHRFLNFFRLAGSNIGLTGQLLFWRPDVILAATQLSLLTFYPVLRLTSTSLVYRCGDEPSLHNRLFQWTWNLVATRACRSVAVSEYIRGRMIQQGAQAERIEVIYSRPPHRDPQVSFDQSPGAADDLVIGYVGQVREQKGVAVLAEAVRRLAEKHEGIHLAIAGRITSLSSDQWAFEFRERIQSDPLLGPRVTFAGYVEDIAGFLAGCDLVVVPSLKLEALANVVFESKLAGIPCVVFPTGGLPEVIETGEDGFVCEAATVEALEPVLKQYIDSPGLAAQQGAAARRSLDSFDLAGFDARWCSLIDEALQ